MAMKMTVATALCVAVALVAVVVAEEKDNGWQEKAHDVAGGVKDKAGEAAEGAKSWTDWAVGKISETFHEDDKKDKNMKTTEKLGQAKEKVMEMASDTQDKASEAYGKANEAYESAKGSVSDHATSGYEAAKEMAAGGAEKAGIPGHNEL